jgi:hypothetical protein
MGAYTALRIAVPLMICADACLRFSVTHPTCDAKSAWDAGGRSATSGTWRSQVSRVSRRVALRLRSSDRFWSSRMSASRSEMLRTGEASE